MGSGSNHDHWPQIGWLRAIAGNGGGGARRGNNSRGGEAWELAGLRRFGVSRAGLGWGLAVEHARGTRNPLEVVARGCRVRSMMHGDEGGSGRRVSPACARSGG